MGTNPSGPDNSALDSMFEKMFQFAPPPIEPQPGGLELGDGRRFVRQEVDEPRACGVAGSRRFWSRMRQAHPGEYEVARHGTEIGCPHLPPRCPCG